MHATGLRLRELDSRNDYANVQNSLTAVQRAWIWPLLVAALIFFASSRSRVPEPGIPNIDKVAHFSVYGLLGTLLVRTGFGKRWAPGVALALASAYGATDELHQSFVPGRSTEFADWVADTCGAAVAIGIYTRWTWYRLRLETPLGRKRRIENTDPAARVSSS